MTVVDLARDAAAPGSVRRTRPVLALFAVWAVAHAALYGAAGALTIAASVAPALALLAWALLAATAREAVAFLRPRWAPVAGPAVLLVAAVQHQVPERVREYWPYYWYPDFAPCPLGGLPWSPSSPPVIVAWRLAWTAADVAVALAVARALRMPARLSGPGRVPATSTRRHILAAVALSAIAALAIASASTLLLEDVAVTPGGTLRWVAAQGPLPAAALAAGLAAGRSRWLPAVLPLAVALDAGVAAVLPGPEGYESPEIWPARLSPPPQVLDGHGASVPYVPWLALSALITVTMVAVLGAVGPLGRRLAAYESRPAAALRLGLLLNTADAAATWLGVRAGAVEEANPVVREAGLGAKWVFVSVLMLALWRLRPSLLWLVTGAYGLVVAYHILGATLFM